MSGALRRFSTTAVVLHISECRFLRITGVYRCVRVVNFNRLLMDCPTGSRLRARLPLRRPCCWPIPTCRNRGPAAAHRSPAPFEWQWHTDLLNVEIRINGGPVGSLLFGRSQSGASASETFALSSGRTEPRRPGQKWPAKRFGCRVYSVAHREQRACFLQHLTAKAVRLMARTHSEGMITCLHELQTRCSHLKESNQRKQRIGPRLSEFGALQLSVFYPI